MDDDANARMFAAHACDLLRSETLVHGAVSFPQDDARVANRIRRVSAKLLVRVPDNHLFERNAHAIAGVAAKMFVGEEQDLFAILESPLQNRSGVGAGADRAAMLAGERLDGGCGVHIADRKSTRLNSSHPSISYAVFCLKKKT